MRRPEFWILAFFLFVAFARDFLANGLPLYCRVEGHSFYPGLRIIVGQQDRSFAHPVLDSVSRENLWRSYPFEAAVFAPVPFFAGQHPGRAVQPLQKPGAVAQEGAYQWRHWLGTNVDGHDVAAGMVSGARIALFVGGVVVVISLILGLLLGGMAGLWGDTGLKFPRAFLFAAVAGGLCIWFWCVTRYAWMSPAHAADRDFLPRFASALLIAVFFGGIGQFLRRWSWWNRSVVFPADMVIMRLAEICRSIPVLIFLIAASATLPALGSSIWMITAFIGLLSWPGIALLIRGELLRIRALDYIAALRGLGFSEARILLRHALPNALPPLLVQLPLAIKNAMLLEASISFLGQGIETFTGKSWGNLLLSARGTPYAWWVWVPPGLALLLIVIALNRYADRYQRMQSSLIRSAA
jgi:peptide/nickel transport system permease protein